MVSRGATQQSSAPYNRRLVLDTIRRQGPMSRKDVVELVSLSPQTVANITSDLESTGLIRSKRLKTGKLRGQPPIVFDIDPRGGSSIGISIEANSVTAALVNPIGEIVAKEEVDLDASDKRLVLKEMVRLVRKLLKQASRSKRLWGIGVGLPGPFSVKGMHFGPTALETWGDLSILDELHHRTQLPVFHSVDSVAGALGESLFGVARNLDEFFYLHLGVGLGGILVANRSPYKGANGNATEISHVPMVANGKQCYCGNRGCLERYFSLHALAEELQRDDIKHGDKKVLAELLDSKDEALIRWCRKTARHFRNAICMIENLLDPETIVFGGTAPRSFLEHLVQVTTPLHGSVRSGVPGSQPRIMISERVEDSAILGAAVLPIYELLSPRFDTLLQRPRPATRVEDLLGSQSSGTSYL